MVWFNLKVGKFQNENMESSYCPKYEWKFWEILPWIIFQTFSFILLAMRRLHIFVLKFIGLWQSWKTVFDIYFNPKTNFKNDRSIAYLQKYVFIPGNPCRNEITPLFNSGNPTTYKDTWFGVYCLCFYSVFLLYFSAMLSHLCFDFNKVWKKSTITFLPLCTVK